MHRIPLDSVVLEVRFVLVQCGFTMNPVYYHTLAYALATIHWQILTLRGGIHGFADPIEFPWIEPPPLEHLTSGVARLRQLSAVVTNASDMCKVTPLGR